MIDVTDGAAVSLHLPSEKRCRSNHRSCQTRLANVRLEVVFVLPAIVSGGQTCRWFTQQCVGQSVVTAYRTVGECGEHRAVARAWWT